MGAVVEYAHRLRENGVENASSLTSLLCRLRVIDVLGNRYPPTKKALVELLKWHSGGEAVVAVPAKRLAMEMSCSPRLVGALLKELEEDGEVRRHKGKAPGNLYVTELDQETPKLSLEPLTPTQEHLLQVLKDRMNDDGLLQTNEYEMAVALDLSKDSAVQTLMGLRRKGYVSATVAEYGRPYVVKVFDSNEKPEPIHALCFSCRRSTEMTGAVLRRYETSKGARYQWVGCCKECDKATYQFTSETKPVTSKLKPDNLPYKPIRNGYHAPDVNDF